MPKKIPMRQCIGCGEMKEKKSLVRIIRSPEGEISLDTTGRANGRGAYLCRSVSCLQLAEKKKALNRAYGMSVPSEIYRSLEKSLAGASPHASPHTEQAGKGADYEG